jgi:hypothetical protein
MVERGSEAARQAEALIESGYDAVYAGTGHRIGDILR